LKTKGVGVKEILGWIKRARKGQARSFQGREEKGEEEFLVGKATKRGRRKKKRDLGEGG